MEHTVNKPHIMRTIQISHDEMAESPREWDSLGTMACFHRRYTLGDKDGVYDLKEALTAALDQVFKSCRPALHKQGYTSADQEIPCSEPHMFNDHMDGNDCKFCGGCEMGDNPFHFPMDDAGSISEALAFCEAHQDRMPAEYKLYTLRLFLYDHSGITMNTTGFSCGWDSGQVGWIFCTHKQVLESQPSWKYITRSRSEQVETWLKGEVKTYDQYITGSVYEFAIWEHDALDDPMDGEEIGNCCGFFSDDFGRDWVANGMASYWPEGWESYQIKVGDDVEQSWPELDEEVA